MEKECKTHTTLRIHSPGHQMALGIKIKGNCSDKLVIKFYDPNQTATHKRVFFGAKNIIDVKTLTAYDFLDKQRLECYGLKENNLSLFVKKSIANNSVSVKKLPDNTLQGVVVNFAMGAGLRDIIKNICADIRLVELTEPQMETCVKQKMLMGYLVCF